MTTYQFGDYEAVERDLAKANAERAALGPAEVMTRAFLDREIDRLSTMARVFRTPARPNPDAEHTDE